MKIIIQRFYDLESDYYGTLIEFIALTGGRPEEAIALTANDVKPKGGRSYIRFSKAYSNRVLLPHTKNRAIRLFPINEQLEALGLRKLIFADFDLTPAIRFAPGHLCNHN